MISEGFNMDCRVGMRGMKDKQYSLAIVDPPYGIGEDGKSNHSRNKAFGSSSFGEKNTRKTIVQAKKYTPKSWDSAAPDAAFFNELRRVSKNQIVFRANHFIASMPFNSSCWIVWDKDNGASHFSDCELAWTSFKSAVRRFKFRWNGMLQENMAEKESRIHPTQKPVALYRWLLSNYAQPGDTILDTHLGSGSSRIAAHQMGFDFTGYELDPEYFADQEKRFALAIQQQSLFQ
jgi:site-specific DNA-methyltransferase (adenine-specific)